jgi:hypothetical protein
MKRIKAGNQHAPVGKLPALRNTPLPLARGLIAIRVSKHAKAKGKGK